MRQCLACLLLLVWTRYRVVVSLLPERVCHRLLWAIGDSKLPDGFLKHLQHSLQCRWRSYRFRCADNLLRPWGTFQTLLILCTVLLVKCYQSAHALFKEVYIQRTGLDMLGFVDLLSNILNFMNVKLENYRIFQLNTLPYIPVYLSHRGLSAAHFPWRNPRSNFKGWSVGSFGFATFISRRPWAFVALLHGGSGFPLEDAS